MDFRPPTKIKSVKVIKLLQLQAANPEIVNMESIVPLFIPTVDLASMRLVWGCRKFRHRCIARNVVNRQMHTEDTTYRAMNSALAFEDKGDY